MKFFLQYLGILSLILIVMAYIADGISVFAFTHTENRGKVNYAYNAKPLVLDVIVLGSSRAENHLSDNPFTQKGRAFFNFGMSGSKLKETSLLLKLLIEKKWTMKTILLQVDVNMAIEESNVKGEASFYPYLNESKIIEEHLFQQNNNCLKGLPYYRFLKNSTVIGFRESFMAMGNFKTKMKDHNGFYPLDGMTEKGSETSNFRPKRNKYYEEIKTICKKNKIRLIAITTPYCQNNVSYTRFVEKLVHIYPEIKRYDQVVTDNKFFSTCGHMNKVGAEIFTEYIIEKEKL